MLYYLPMQVFFLVTCWSDQGESVCMTFETLDDGERSDRISCRVEYIMN